MIVLKSAREIELMRAAGRLVAEAHRIVRRMVRPGVRTIEIDRALEQLFAEHRAQPLFKGVPGKVPFPAVACISLNEEVVHGIPGERVIKEGDIVSVDTGCRLNGWCGDAAQTVAVGQVPADVARLLAVTRETLEIAIREMGRQRRWSQVAAKMQAHVKAHGFSVIERFVGHGIGRHMHEDPQVPNFVSPQLLKHDFWLEKGLVLAIEPMVCMGTKHVKVLRDHWTVITQDRRPSAHFEHTVAITDSGPDVLTAGAIEE